MRRGRVELDGCAWTWEGGDARSVEIVGSASVSQTSPPVHTARTCGTSGIIGPPRIGLRPLDQGRHVL